MSGIERKIYNGYAFTENEREKAKINYEIYKELRIKYKIRNICGYPTDEDLSENDIVYSRKAGYAHADYKVYKCPKVPQEISVNELLLIFDDGNLCFGGGRQSENLYTVSED